MSEDAFSILHDGIIRDVVGSCPGEVSLHVQCDYLRRSLSEPGDRFILQLKNCSVLFYQSEAPHEKRFDEFSDISNLKLEILSSEIKNEEILVYTGTGTLHLRFESMTIWLNSHVRIAEEELEQVAETYWDEWSKKTKRAFPRLSQ